MASPTVRLCKLEHLGASAGKTTESNPSTPALACLCGKGGRVPGPGGTLKGACRSTLKPAKVRVAVTEQLSSP